ncbi:carbohydrate-binding domain-containing protein [Promicromonospora sp. MEB111]|uniref:carbohydrate-binding domain-containing protein n=1 Tax=Promicromonospora sp. MEB111 TaxID=3040301 RepID=UPI002551A894|nr:carbohydrate-binding domain-containing protein [Promicromonospora sp. MEB111]
MKIRRPRPVLTATISGALVLGALAGCGTATAETTSSTNTTTISEVATTTDDALADNEDYSDLAALADETWDTGDETSVSLDGDSATVSGDGAIADGSTVTISAPGTYRISGTLDDGQIVVGSEADGLVRLVLDGADITSSTGSAVAVTQADDVSVVLADGSSNSLTDAATYADTSEDAPNAALFSADSMVVSGTGSLDVTGNANDGIASKDGLVIAGGDITVTAVDDGVRGKDFLVVTDGTLDVDAEGDGLKADNEDGTDDAGETVGYAALLGGTVTVASGDDGVHAESDLVVDGATVTVAESVEGLEAAHILVASGTVLDVTSSDDGFNAAGGTSTTTDGAATTDDTAAEPPASGTMPGGEPPQGGGGGGGGGGMPGEAAGDFSLTITGGDVTVDAGGDGLDSNGTLTISGGDVTVFGPTDGGNGTLDSAGALTVQGGTLLAVGTSSMLQTPGDGSEGWVAATFDTLAAGTDVTVVDSSGTTVAAETLTKDTQSLVLASENVTTGETYTIQADGAEVATATAGDVPATTGR